LSKHTSGPLPIGGSDTDTVQATGGFSETNKRNHKGHFMIGASQNVIIQNDVTDILRHEEYVLGYDMTSMSKWFV